MLNKRRSTGLLIMPILLWAVACSDTPSDPLDAAEEARLNLDVAHYVADQTVDDIAVMTFETQGLFGGPMAGPPGGGMRGFGFDGSLSVTRTVEFFDVTGAPMDSYHFTDTDSIHIYFLLEGERSRTTERGSMTMEVSRERNMGVSGLADIEIERTWNGTGASSKERALVSDEWGDRSYYMTSTSTITNVVIPVPRTEDSWPVSGTIERTVHVEWVKDGETHTRDCTVSITFNDTQFVTIEINGEEFTFDLATKKIVED